MNNIRVAESAGFCFGVKRAIEMAYEAIGVEPKLYSYGQLIHNKTVTDDLASKGLEIVESLDGLTEGTLLIRSHGVGKALYDEAEAKGLKILDGTCPFVKKSMTSFMINWQKVWASSSLVMALILKLSASMAGVKMQL